MSYTILFPDSRSEVLDLEREIVGPDVELINTRKMRFDEIDPQTWARADAIVLRHIHLRAEQVAQLERARIIVRNGVGFDVIDLEATGKAGIVVCNVPDYGTTEVADTAIAMMLTFARSAAS